MNEEEKKIKLYLDKDEIDLIIEAINFRIDELVRMDLSLDLGSCLSSTLKEVEGKYYGIRDYLKDKIKEIEKKEKTEK